MKLVELFETVRFTNLLKALESNYDHINPEGYFHAWKQILCLTPKEMDDIVSVEVKSIPDILDKNITYFNTSGISKSNERYAIEFCTWSEWLSLEIFNPSGLSDEDFLSHVIWEMTFMGFSEDKISKERDLLDEAIQEVKDMESGKIPNTMKSYSSTKELFDDLDLED